MVLQGVSVRPGVESGTPAGATHQTCIVGQAEVALRQGGCSSDARAGLGSSRKPVVTNGSRLCGLHATSSLRTSLLFRRVFSSGNGCGTQTLQETPPCLTIRRFKGAGLRTSRIQLVVTRREGVAVQTSPVSIVIVMVFQKDRSAAGRQSKRGIRRLWHTEVASCGPGGTRRCQRFESQRFNPPATRTR